MNMKDDATRVMGLIRGLYNGDMLPLTRWGILYMTREGQYFIDHLGYDADGNESSIALEMISTRRAAELQVAQE